MSEHAERVRAIVAGKAPLPADAELPALVGALKQELEFGAAGELLTKARSEGAGNAWVTQQLALCTYKDEELLPRTRFERALSLLEEIGLRSPTNTDGETLGLGGAVYKRMWEHAGQLEHLHESLAFYRAAWERGAKSDDRLYGVVNAAFILDVLAARARAISKRSGTPTTQAELLRDQAKDLRAQALHVAAKLAQERPDDARKYWFLATRAELQFGLGRFDEAGADLAAAAALESRDSWKVQTTFGQLVKLARLMPEILPPPLEGSNPSGWHPAWRALLRFLGEDAAPAFSCHRGKVGLALSGGGFRASLFHLGVLARLAEMDVLRGVDVLSTVSGGSIVGAHYYLELQHLLQTKLDRDLARADYIRLVRRVQRKFFHGVRQNLRTRALNNLGANLKMAFRRSYTRSRRMGELYEARLYSAVKDGKESDRRTMKQLLIEPAGEHRPFKPKFSNWRRRAKVPVLLLNATSLNSGHNWQFTGRWMGEPPGSFDAEVDMNERYRRLWYEQAPTPALRAYRLGDAVAASACVPGLFEPLVLEGLYPGRTVRLVDGGVHDNQGVEGLLDEGCTLILCSDASGQMADVRRPADSLLAVPLRSNSILMDRVRETEYESLRGRVESRSLQGLFFIHLKKGLEVAPLDWIRCQDPTVPPAVSTSTTPYGIDKTLQRQLAAIRTDLDSFTEVEAYSLMLSGYLMAEHEFKRLQGEHLAAGERGTWGDYWIDAPRGRWPFLRLKEIARQPPDSSDARRQELGRQLAASSMRLFKVWKVSRPLQGGALALGVAAIAVLFSYIRGHWHETMELAAPSMTVGQLTLAAVVLVGGFAWPMLKWLQPQQAMRGWAGKTAIAFLGWALTNLHLWIFDPWFLRIGRMKRLLELR
jgi:predicted acylesterase/phospholipase RssA